MSFDRRPGERGGTGGRAASLTAPGPGKRTLTEQIAAPVQAEATPRPAAAPSSPRAGSQAAPVPDGAPRDPSARATLTSLFGRSAAPAAELAPFGEAFGVDVSNVALHRGSSRARMLGVEALAERDEIHVADAGLDLGSAHGRDLIGHELAHVMQQRGGRVTATESGAHGAYTRDASHEREADEVGARIARGEPAGVAGVAGRASSAVAQFRVGSNLAPRDPVILNKLTEAEPMTDGAVAAEAPAAVRGEVVQWLPPSSYAVRFMLSGRLMTQPISVDDLDLVRGHDYQGRGAAKVNPSIIPFTRQNLEAATRPRKLTAGGVPAKRDPGPAARDALRGMDVGQFDARLAAHPDPMLGRKLVHADSQALAPGSGDARPRGNLQRIAERAHDVMVSDLQGKAVVAGGVVTFTPRHKNQMLPGSRRPQAQLEVEVYGYGPRTYVARHGKTPGRLTAADGRAAAMFTPEDPQLLPIAGTLSGFSAEVPGVVKLMRAVEPQPAAKPAAVMSGSTAPTAPDAVMATAGSAAAVAAMDTSVTSPAVTGAAAPAAKPPSVEAVQIELVAIEQDTLHVRDEDGRYFLLRRAGDAAMLTLTDERARGAGGGGGFATTRSDLVAPDSYVWYGPASTPEHPALDGRLADDRRRGELADAPRGGLVIEGRGDSQRSYHETNTPLASQYRYFKLRPTPRRWFGPPADGERVGLRKPDYGGPFTDELTPEAVAAGMAGLGDAVRDLNVDGARVAIPRTISVWQLRAAVAVPRRLRQDGDASDARPVFNKPPDADRKKMKDRRLHWDGAWSGGQRPGGWESRQPGSPDRDEMMEGASATAEARRPRGAGGLGANLAYARQEWCHLIGHGDGGNEDAANLAAGTHYANTEQLALEEAARALRAAGRSAGVSVLLKVTTYLHPRTNCADAIRYKVELLRKAPTAKPAVPGAPARAAAAAAAGAAGPVEIFDHLFDGQSQSFDRNEFAIARQALLAAGVAQLRDWGIEPQLDVEAASPATGAKAKPALPRWGRFGADGATRIAWPTAGDGNCAFNGMAQTLLRLVAEGRMTAADAGAPIGLAQAGIQALVGQIDAPGGIAAIERAMARPLRTLAVQRMRADRAARGDMGDRYTQEMHRQICVEFEIKNVAAASDLFQPGTPLGRHLTREVNAACAEIRARRDFHADNAAAAQAWLDDDQRTRAAQFAGAGMDRYLDDMERNADHAGPPEINAIADAYQLHMTIFQRTAAGFTIWRGAANAGVAPLDAWWTEARLNAARALGIFEGVPDAHRQVAFAINNDAAIRQRFMVRPRGFDRFHRDVLPDLPEMLNRVAQLRGGGGYRAPIEVGMYRHLDAAHWSAVTNDRGNADLAGAADQLRGRVVPDMVDQQDDDLGFGAGDAVFTAAGDASVAQPQAAAAAATTGRSQPQQPQPQPQWSQPPPRKRPENPPSTGRDGRSGRGGPRESNEPRESHARSPSPPARRERSDGDPRERDRDPARQRELERAERAAAEQRAAAAARTSNPRRDRSPPRDRDRHDK